MDQKNRTAGSGFRPWGFSLLITSLAILAAGWWYYRAEAKQIRQEKFQALAAIGELKSGQIRQWRQERLGDIALISGNPFMTRAITEFARGGAPPDLHAELRESLHRWVTVNNYSNALLLDPQGRVLLADKDEHDAADAATRRAVAAAIADRGPVFSDFFRCPEGTVHVDVATAVATPAGEPRAVVVLRSNAETYLYPLIQSWPTPSRSAESLIVQRDGEEVIFLNELRHRTGTALALREPLLKFAQTLLQGLGYKALAAPGPRKTLQLAETCAEEIHLLLTDVVMPEMSGREFTELLRRLRPGIKSLFMSGYTSDVIAHQGVLDAGVNFIQKPFSKDELARKVREALA